jgi:hypothetical protein
MNPLSQNNQMSIVVLQRLEKQYKKVAKGNIIIVPKQMMNYRNTFEKWINLDLFEKRVYEKTPTSLILQAYENKGLISLKVQLLDLYLNELPRLKGKSSFKLGQNSPPNKGKPEKLSDDIVAMLRKNLELVSIANDNNQNKITDKYKDITSKVSNFIKENKNENINEGEDLYEDFSDEDKKNKFLDRCSNISTSVVNGIIENRVDVLNMKIGIGTRLEKIELLTYDRLDEIIPKDPEEMKLFIEDYANKVRVISEPYFRNLKNDSKLNNSLKSQAKEIYQTYKDLKKSILIERTELKSKLEEVDSINAANIEENKRLLAQLNNLKAEVRFYTNEIGEEDNAVYKEEDYQMMLAIIDDVTKNGVDVFEGLNGKEHIELENVLKKYEEEKDYKPIEDPIPSKLDEIMKDLLSKEAINPVTYSKTFIPNTYKFDSQTVKLYVEDDVLKVQKTDFTSFEEWIVTNFPKVKIRKDSLPNNLAKSASGGSGTKKGATKTKAAAKPKKSK